METETILAAITVIVVTVAGGFTFLAARISARDKTTPTNLDPIVEQAAEAERAEAIRREVALDAAVAEVLEDSEKDDAARTDANVAFLRDRT